MSLGKWGLLLCWGWREASIQALSLGMGRCATDWEHADSTASLVLYTSKAVRWRCTFLDSLVRLTRWLILGTILYSRWTHELVFLPGRVSSACMALLFGTPNQAIVCTEFLGQVRTPVFFLFVCLFFSENRERYGLCSLFKCHFNQGCWVDVKQRTRSQRTAESRGAAEVLKEGPGWDQGRIRRNRWQEYI